MSNQSLANRVHAQLKQAIASERLPDDVQERAIQLKDRLETPIRMVVMGRPGSGKSSIVNLLIGREVLPDDIELPTTHVTHGRKPHTIVTLADGSKRRLQTVNAYDIAEIKPVFVELHMQLPALERISLLEVVTPNNTAALQKASQWAAKRTELAIWCTEAFDKNEQAIWAQMPDVLKDHAFLMLTKADQLTAKGTLNQILDATRALVSHEFSDILPISILDAIAARDLDGSVDKDRMRSSGGLALISAVRKQVDQGRQSFVDLADFLLHQHADLLEDKIMKVPEDYATVLSAVIDATGPTKQPEDTTDPASETVPAPGADETAAEPTLASDPEPDAAVVTLQPATREAYQQAVAYIIENGRNLIDMTRDLGEAAPSQIIAETVEHVQWLSDHLNTHGDDSDEALQRARDTAFDAADLVQLMQMEKRNSAAIEAVSVLLQLKHELQADLAA